MFRGVLIIESVSLVFTFSRTEYLQTLPLGYSQAKCHKKRVFFEIFYESRVNLRGLKFSAFDVKQQGSSLIVFISLCFKLQSFV